MPKQNDGGSVHRLLRSKEILPLPDHTASCQAQAWPCAAGQKMSRIAKNAQGKRREKR